MRVPGDGDRSATPPASRSAAPPVAITTDSFVVTPLVFPGGSIGELAVNGTVNDLAVCGAGPVALVTTFVLEAGLPTEVLEAEVRAMAGAARAAGVAIVGGDTKVVEHGKADRLYITTTGIGRPLPGVTLGARSVRPGDKILLSGPIGDHGITILLARGELDLEADLRSDTRSVLPLVEALVGAAGPASAGCAIRRAAVSATSLNELARDCGLAVHLFEETIPVRDEVRGACELLGLDPLHIANEGQFLAVVAPEQADGPSTRCTPRPAASDAVIIGEVREEPARRGAGDHAVRRHPDRGHAGRRSAAAHLLGDHMPMAMDLTTRVEERLLARNGVFERFFAREAPVSPRPAGRCPSGSCAADGCSPSAAVPTPPTPSTSRWSSSTR